MSINVDTLWTIVNQDLARKDHAGYSSSDEFNRVLNIAQIILFDYYIDQGDQRAKNALRPFMVEADVSISSGSGSLPADFQYRIEAGPYVWKTFGGTNVKNVMWAQYLEPNEVSMNINSPIRYPDKSKDRFAYEISGSTLKVYPATATNTWKLKYYRYPVAAERAFSLNTTTQEEEYDAGSSTQLEWNQDELRNFTDIMLFYKGISVRSDALMQWVAGNKQIFNQKLEE